MKKILRYISTSWSWLGKQENHNALMVFVPLVLSAAGIYFQFQIVDIRSSVEELFERQVVETFTKEDIETFHRYTDDRGRRKLEIVLDNKPIPESVNFWFGGFLQSPAEYEAAGNTITVEIMEEDDFLSYLEGFTENISPAVIVISYTKQ